MAVAYIILTSLFLTLLIIYYFSRRKFDYWEKKKVPHEKPVPILGNYARLIFLKGQLGQITQALCRKFPNTPYVGAYYGTEPVLIIQDPELIKLITTKDFYYFSSREVSKYTQREISTQNLFFTQGDRWKVIRQNLTPLFTSAKMKNMFHLIKKCAIVFETMLDKDIGDYNKVEMRSVFIRYTMDCICSAAFGVDSNVMKVGKNNQFAIMGEKIFDISTYRAFKHVARAIWPLFFYGLGLKAFPTEVDEFFEKILVEVFKSRQYKPTSRNDFIDCLLGLKQNKCITGDSLSNLKTGEGKKISMELDDELMIAQCVVFFGAGFETSSNTLSFTLFELAKNEEVQKRAQKEVDTYLSQHNNKLDYDCVTDMPYIEACIDETLRLHPVLNNLAREVVEDYTLPTGVHLEKGTRIHLPVYHLHHNPDFFPEPEQFRPERFLPEEKQKIKPYTYLPFGEGPRTCIGMRFAKMQMLPGLLTILKKYNVGLAEGMPTTVQYEPKSVIVSQSTGGVQMKLTPREGWEHRVFNK